MILIYMYVGYCVRCYIWLLYVYHNTELLCYYIQVAFVIYWL